MLRALDTIKVCCCPNCGRPYHLPTLGGKYRDAILRLLERHADGRSVEEIASSIYAGDANGGPNGACASIRTIIHYMRKQLQPYGWAIKNTHGPGARYRLEAL